VRSILQSPTLEQLLNHPGLERCRVPFRLRRDLDGFDPTSVRRVQANLVGEFRVRYTNRGDIAGGIFGNEYTKLLLGSHWFAAQ